jgi:cytochrome c oxidase assembly protein subunit 15
MSSFVRLAVWTTATTYVLILVGGLVRASGAGLGCPDWPRCFGSWIPPASAAELPAPFDVSQFNPTLMWTEYLNRLLGVAVGFLIFATLISAIRHHRRVPGILWPTVAAFLLTGFQGWLGGRVVAHELAAWIVTVHLIVALVIVSLLVYATLYAFHRTDASGAALPPPRIDVPAQRRLVWVTGAVIAVTLAQVALGAQVRGRVDAALDAGTPRTAALGTVGDYDRWHRDTAAVVVGGSVLLLLLVVTQTRVPRAVARVAYITAGFVGLQVAIGLTMAYLGLTPALQVAHLSTSSLLLGSQTVLLLQARWLR